ncbi:MAG: LysM peptidoglycan-binding domain-containing protein [Planctomycetota bacterium]
MTRETKVGLIFGLGVILLVGVFISDYLNDLDGLQDESVPVDFANYNQSTTNQPPAINLPAASGEQPPREVAAALDRQDGRLGQPQPGGEPPIVVQPAPPLRQFGPGVGSSDIAPIGQGVPHNVTPPAVEQGVPEPVVTIGPEPVVPSVGPAAPPVIDTTEVDMLTQETPDQGGGPVRVEHTVKTGETLAAIARRYYDGDENMWRSIRDANPGKVGPNGEVNANITLVIPVRSVESALADDQDTPDITRRIGEGTPAAIRSRMLVVTVKDGDTLSGLAAKHLGSAGRWRELMDTNTDVLTEPRQLRVGMRLRIPDQATQDLAELANRALAGDPPEPNTEQLQEPSLPSGPRYIVVSGDNLYRIADKTLGDGDRYREIFEINRDQLENADDIRVGMVLKLPQDAVSSAQ